MNKPSIDCPFLISQMQMSRLAFNVRREAVKARPSGLSQGCPPKAPGRKSTFVLTILSIANAHMVNEINGRVDDALASLVKIYIPYNNYEDEESAEDRREDVQDILRSIIEGHAFLQCHGRLMLKLTIWQAKPGSGDARY